MTKERTLLLESGQAELTQSELEENWHFCIDFDYGLTQGEQRKPDGSCAWCGHNYNRVHREPGCQCHMEIGDSPCPVHGDECG